MKNVANANDKILDLDLRMKILEGVLSGRTDAELRKDLHIGTSKLVNYKRDIIDTVTDSYLERVEHFNALTMARLERLYSVAESRALGTVITHEGEQITLLPDRHWVNTAQSLLKTMREIALPDLERARRRDSEGKSKIYATIREVTLVADDPLYKLAQEKMFKTWSETDNDMLVEMLKAKVADVEPDLDVVQGQLADIKKQLPTGIDLDALVAEIELKDNDEDEDEDEEL